jgi:hypothetical protein
LESGGTFDAANGAAGRRRRIGISKPQIVKTIGTLLFALILTGFPGPRCGATVYDSDGSEANVRALVDRAHDGDTIPLPAGTFSWTSRLDIKKGITIQGATIIKGADTENPTIDDATGGPTPTPHPQL